MRRQYRITTSGQWTSNFGYAFLALTNTSGSGRKLTIRSVEVQNMACVATASASVTDFTNTGLTRHSAVGVTGEDMSGFYVASDSTNTLPETVKVYRGVSVGSGVSLINRVSLTRRSAGAGTQNRLESYTTVGRMGKQRRVDYSSSRRNRVTPLNESFVVNQNQAYSFYCLDTVAFTNSVPVRCIIEVSVNGKIFTWNFVSRVSAGLGTWTLANTGTDVVKLISYSFEELGTADTPYIRLVPVGQLYSGDVDDLSKKQVDVVGMDSDYPPLTAATVYTDIGFIPYGSPEKYIADASPTTTLKGLNYLHTKDFDGAVYRTIFPEFCDTYQGSTPNSLKFNQPQSFCDLLVRKSGITINQGEGIALVNSCETATTQAAMSGWIDLLFTFVIDDEPATSPFLVLTGITTGSDVVLLEPNTTNVITSADSVGSSTYAFNYDPDVLTSVDICIYKSGKVPFAIRNLSLGLSGASVPINQVDDRNYI
jgi:hypothetical protein